MLASLEVTEPAVLRAKGRKWLRSREEKEGRNGVWPFTKTQWLFLGLEGTLPPEEGWIRGKG